MYSKLTDSVNIAHSGNYQKGRSGYKICKITPHQMAGKLTGKQCAVNIFGKAGRKASSNYCIGYNGDIVCNVEEENRAYTSSSKWNDCQAITIEVSNSANGTDHITEASWNSLVNLCVDICKRYNFRLNYDGTKNGNLTRHNMFASTDCPGKYLQSRLPELSKIVNERLSDGGGSSSKYKQGQAVEINTPFYFTGGVEGDLYLYDNKVRQNNKDNLCRVHADTKSLVKYDRLIARAIFVFDEGDRCLVQVFNDQFWVKASEVVKGL